MMINTLLLMFLILLPLSSTGGTTEYIDHHVHVACFGFKSDCYFSNTIKNSYKYKIYQYIFDFTKEEAKKFGDALIFEKVNKKILKSKFVSKAVVLAMDEVYEASGTKRKDLTVFYIPNEFVSENIKDKSALLFGASVHPYRPDALAELEKVKKNKAYLIKLLPAIHRFKANDPKLTSYYKKLIELKLPLLIHIDDEGSFGKDHPEYSNPAFLELPLSLGVKVIAAHAGARGVRDGVNNFDAILKLVKKYPNLYVDISAMSIALTRKGQLAKILKIKALKGRILYGSDWPLTHALLSSPYLHVFNIGLKKAYQLSKINNLWDRDVLLKKTFGTPEDVFTNKIY